MKASHFLQLLLLSALWGGTFPMMRIASPQLGPSVLAMGRIVVATATLALLFTQRRSRALLQEIVAAGLPSIELHAGLPES